MNHNKQDVKRFEEELGGLVSVEKLDSGVYLLSGNEESLRNSKNPLALLPFCIKDPNCEYRREPVCNFSLSSCDEDQTKSIYEILLGKNISFYFINVFEDVQKAVESYHKEKGQSLDACIALMCPKDLIETKNEVHGYIKEYNAPLLVFLLTNYEGCRMDGKSSRQFKGQTKLDIELFKRTLNKYFF